VAVARLDHGATHSIDPELVGELRELLATLGADAGVRGVVLTGAGEKFFSIGFDLPRLLPLAEDDFARFFRDFDRLCLELFTFPKPVVAALAGHAIAGGSILALCCDYRYVAEGRKLMGLNEVKLGVPVPFAADRILRHVAGDRVARDLCYEGEFYGPADLLAMGVADRALPPAEVVPEAIRAAAALGAAPAETFARIKQIAVGEVAAGIRERLDEEERRFVEIWYSPEARALLWAALDKF
jgi:enoyl-CoA hydratase/carnithine racemase